MFNLLTNLVKAAVAVAASPVAATVDLVTLPASSLDPQRGPFDRTADLLKTAGECIDEAVKPTKE